MKNRYWILFFPALLLFLFCCNQPSGEQVPGSLTITVTGMTVGDGHKITATVWDAGTPVASDLEAVVSGASTLLCLALGTGDTWIGAGGTSYEYHVSIDMQDENNFGGPGDYAVYPYRSVVIDGNMTINLTAADFTLMS